LAGCNVNPGKGDAIFNASINTKANRSEPLEFFFSGVLHKDNDMLRHYEKP